MKKRIVTFLMIAIILVGMTSLCHAYVAYYSLFVVSGEDGNIYQLKILPDGQILDTNIQYTNGGSFGNGSLTISPDNRFLFAAGGYAVYQYQIQADGSLVYIGSTNPGGVAFTPNEQLVIGWNTIYSLTSTGDLINGISSPTVDYPYIDPLGRGLLGVSSFSTFSAYTINYNTRTLTQTTTFPYGNGLLFGINFTPNGKLGFLYGFNLSPNNTGDLWVWKIDSTFNITTSQLLSVSQEMIEDLAISNDSRYLWADTGNYIELFTIDTLGNVTDTGKEYYVSNDTGGTLAVLQRNTPDGTMAVFEYEGGPPVPGNFATAFINGDGSLTWTGYSFVFEYGVSVVDCALVPVYATGIPEEFWKDPPPEMILHDTQEILMNP